MTQQNRNIEGLLANAQKRHEETVAHAEDAIVRLYSDGHLITFPTVAHAAGVSVAWLYQHQDIKQRIQLLREQQCQHCAPPVVSRKDRSEASKDAVITALKERVKELTTENHELKKQLEVAYGQLYQHRQAASAQRTESK